jgi:hypothetical protein
MVGRGYLSIRDYNTAVSQAPARDKVRMKDGEKRGRVCAHPDEVVPYNADSIHFELFVLVHDERVDVLHPLLLLH